MAEFVYLNLPFLPKYEQWFEHTRLILDGDLQKG